MIMKAALYARVSSDQQAQASTIDSQVSALRERIHTDGFTLCEQLEFIDDGYSGSTLIRPRLEALRDAVAMGEVDRIYVHSPDRLARNYAYQILIVDEFKHFDVEVIFLNHALDDTPEASLLLQMQGMIAEYERAKILERSRRGKRFTAQRGSVSVLSRAPYGYTYIDKVTGGGQASFKINEEEASVVRQIFIWVGRDRLSISGVCRRLQANGIRTQKGNALWNPSVISALLRNPTYKGDAAFGKNRIGKRRPQIRVKLGQREHPRRVDSVYMVPPEEWISIPVPALVDASLFEAVQEQLQENAKRMRQWKQSARRHLLQGLTVCKQCHYAWYGVSSKKNHSYYYYRCSGSEPIRFGGQKLCDSKPMRAQGLEALVWQSVANLLENPQYLQDEYNRRLAQLEKMPDEHERLALIRYIEKLRRGMTRLIDSYAEGYLDKEEFEPRIKGMKQRLKALEDHQRQLLEKQSLQRELTLIIGHLEAFKMHVKAGLKQADWVTKRAIVLSLIKRIEIDQNHVSIVFRVGPPSREGDTHSLGKGSANLQHHRRCATYTTLQKAHIDLHSSASGPQCALG